MKKILVTALAAASAAVLGGCAGTMPSPGGIAAPYGQGLLPEAVRVPDGHRVTWETVGVGRITYECRAKADAAGVFEWTFVGPQADLASRAGAKLGTYFGPPATWAAADGSRITGTQVAVAPNGAGNLPFQLVKANPATGAGAMNGVTYVQRVATVGGVAPTSACDAGTVGRKEVVNYRADYVFWKAV